MNKDKVAEAVRRWVESFVVGLNLCPFAGRELANNRVRFAVTDSTSEVQLLGDLQVELERLDNNAAVETTLLIHPKVLKDFFEYNQFLNRVDTLLVQLQLEGIYQVASFHPDYRFDGTGPDDAENFTNRSPFPMLHLIREESLERAIAGYTDVDKIPGRNIDLMNSLGKDRLELILQFSPDGNDNGES